MKTLPPLNELAKIIHEGNVQRGFFEDKKNIGEMLMLTVSELAEALEADRKNKYTKVSIESVNGWFSEIDFRDNFTLHVKDTFEDEIADTIIRCLDLAAYLGINVEAHIIAKMRYNSSRPFKHGKKY